MRPLRSSAGRLALRVSLLALAASLQSPTAMAARISDDAPSRDGLWEPVTGDAALSPGRDAPKLAAFRIVRSDPARLKSRVARAPWGNVGEPVGTAFEMSLPMPDGTYQRFAVERVALLSPEVQARFPDIQTFRAQGLDDVRAKARIEISPFGFRAYVMRAGGDAVIDPVGDGVSSRVFWKRDATPGAFVCGVTDDPLGASKLRVSIPAEKRAANGANIRTYRFAAGLTGEWTQFFGSACAAGDTTCLRNAAAAALTTTMNRVTGLLERDADVSFNITSMQIFTDPATDPYSNGGKVDGTLLGDNQTALDAAPGNANYDIGHVFTAGTGGGLVQGRACNGGNKARGGTGSTNPVGDAYDVDYVAHEVGHQLNADHTWSSNVSNCTAGQFISASGFEPGSGSTIMAYAGICGGDDLQPHSDAYYHVRSIDQITDFWNNAGSGGSCGVASGTGNSPPVANAGGNFTIPRNTPFVLTATGSDPDGDGLTWDWEQYDNAPAQTSGFPSAAATAGPLFRSFNPTASTSRTFPVMAKVLGTGTSNWETLPNVDRTMNFRVTARDNRANGGGTDFSQMAVTVTGAPFSVNAPSGGAQQCGTSSTLTWTVGGGSIAPNVRVDYSGDDGASFASLIGSTANDGTEGYTVPRPPTANGRIKVSGLGNIFFNVSPRFSIIDTLSPDVTAPGPKSAECSSPAGTPVTLGTATTNDVCDPSPSLTNNAPSLFPLGLTTVTYSSTDHSNNTGTATQAVNVVDTTPPVVTPPPPVTAECTGPSGTPVNIGLATAADICDASLAIGNNAPAVFPLGTTTVTWTARDDSNNVGSATELVKVQDTTPPTLSVAVSPAVLWPPNHRMVKITASIAVADICDASPTVKVLSVVSNEPDDGLGDGDTAGDIQGVATGTDDREFFVRAERDGAGTGRIYTVTYQARDASGNTTVRTATVTVPQNAP